MNDNVMKYKGYTAFIRYSATDRCLVGKVQGIEDSITFEGSSVEEMEHEFKVALDDYLHYCEEIGKKPDRPYSGKLMVRLPPEVHKVVAETAEAGSMSINEVILSALDRAYHESKPKRTRKKERQKA